jgi:hypothetical protein
MMRTPTSFLLLVTITASLIDNVASFSANPNANNPMFLSSTNYLNSLNPPSTDTSVKEGTEPSMEEVISNLEEVAKLTPDEHYAKHHPGAGWAGYKDSKFGGYLDNLSSENTNINTYEEGTKAGRNLDGNNVSQKERKMLGGYLDNLSENTFEEGKVADYGTDIRWGAQVYLDRLDGNKEDEVASIAVAGNSNYSSHCNDSNSHFQEAARVEPVTQHAAAQNHPGIGGYLDSLGENTFEEGKVADYGTDIRWGAQVYLDNLD